MSNGKYMVCISTRQNTANLVPFLQFDFDHMFLLETDYAKKQGWSDGLCRVIEARGKKIKRYSLEEGTQLSNMLARIRGLVSGQPAICWNIGGGQKMQQTAMLRVFQERLEKQYQDWACYSDPATKKTYSIQGDRFNLDSEETPVGASVGLDDVLTVFGLKKRESSAPLRLWHHAMPEVIPDKDAFRDINLFWDKAARRNLLNWNVTKKGAEPEVLIGLKHGFPDFFEQVVQHEVAKVLRTHAGKHHVTEAWANVRVKNEHDREVAEWDVVLVTDFGTLVILDAKTGVFKHKDEDARLHNLDEATGAYGQFWLVIPCMKEEIADGWFGTLGSLGQEYQKIPFELRGLRSKFLAVTGEKDPLWIKKGKNWKLSLAEKQKLPCHNKNLLQLYSLESMLNTLKLLKK